MGNKQLAIRMVLAAYEREHGITLQDLCANAIDMYAALEENDKYILNAQLDLLEKDTIGKLDNEELIDELNRRLGKE